MLFLTHHDKIIYMTGDSHPKAMLWLLIILVLIGFAAAATYLGRESRELAKTIPAVSGDTSQRQSRVYTVYYGLGVFSPTNIRIHIGDSVKFQNDGDKPIRVVTDSTGGTPDLPGFDSGGDVPPGGIFSYTFNKEGIFGYHNVKNASEEGTVIVRP